MAQKFGTVVVIAATLLFIIPLRAHAAATKLFSAQALKAAKANCEQEFPILQPANFMQLAENDPSDNPETQAYIMCLISDLGLWTNERGFNSKRIAKLLSKHKMTDEIIVVVDYCNTAHRNAEPQLWAWEAYKCATAGRMGAWVKEYIQELGTEQST